MRAEDINIVVNQIDPYLNKKIVKKSYEPKTGVMANVERPVIVDDGALPGNDPMMTGSQVATAQLLKDIPGNDSLEAYWMEYGRRIHQRFLDEEPMGIRCDSCTALAFYLFRQNGCSGHISVIEQAKGNANGHWFLLVGCPPDAAINVLKRKISRNGLTTVPTKADFVTSTSVAGCFGDKSRSTKLKALDTKLGEYHAGTATLNQLADSFTAWIDKKDKRQGEEIDSIRNAEGQMEALRQQLRWLGKAV